MKKILLLSGIALSTLSFAQTDPTLYSFSITDTLCEWSYEKIVGTVTVEDLDGDSSWVNFISSTPGGYIDDGMYALNFISSTPTTWTYEIGFTEVGAPDGVLSLFNVSLSLTNGLSETGVGLMTDVGVYGNIDPVITTLPTLCDNGQLFDLRPYISGVDNYDNFEWDGDFDFKDGYMMDPYVYSIASLDGLEYSGKNAAGCYMYATAIVSINNAPSVTPSSTNPSACNTPDGSAQITTPATGGAAPFDVYWSNGDSDILSFSSSSLISNLSPGFYYANVTDANGCKIVETFAITDDSDIDIAETVTNESCKNESMDGEIDLGLYVDPSTEPITSVYWTNGSTDENLTGVHAGEYSVLINTAGGCVGAGTFIVDALPPLNISVMGSTDFDCSTGTPGSIDISTSGGSGDYDWLWTVTGGISEDMMAGPSGVHGCVVTDNVTGCSMTWFRTINEVGGPYVYVDDYELPNCGVNNGSIEVSAYDGFAPITDFSWSSGAVTEDVTGIGSGLHTLTVTDAAGCKGYAFANLASKAPYQPQICMLTVDSSLTYNQVVWQKEMGSVVDGFNIYRETSEYNKWEKVASRDYALESFYQDNVASPLNRSWRYYITSFDECGNESVPSAIHKTMHAVAHTADGGVTYEITWDQYEGILYSSVNVLRYDAVTADWTDLGTFPVSGSTTDAPPTSTDIDYMVEFNLAFPCTSTKATDHNSSRSNKTSSSFNPNGSTLLVDETELGTISIYPNPTETNLTLYIEKPEEFNTIEVLDINGQVLFTTNQLNGVNLIELENYAAGLYFIRLVSDDRIITEKINKI